MALEQRGVGRQEFNGQIDGLSRTLEKLKMVDADLQIGEPLRECTMEADSRSVGLEEGDLPVGFTHNSGRINLRDGISRIQIFAGFCFLLTPSAPATTCPFGTGKQGCFRPH